MHSYDTQNHQKHKSSEVVGYYEHNIVKPGKAEHILGVGTSLKWNSFCFANPIHTLLTFSDHFRPIYALPIGNVYLL